MRKDYSKSVKVMHVFEPRFVKNYYVPACTCGWRSHIKVYKTTDSPSDPAYDKAEKIWREAHKKNAN